MSEHIANERLVESLKGVFRVNLGAVPGERVLVFTDLVPEGEDIPKDARTKRDALVRIARAAAEAARSLGIEAAYREFTALGSHGSEPGPELWAAAFGEKAAAELESSGVLGPIRAKTADAETIDKARKIVLEHKGGRVDAVVALSYYSSSHTRFRDLLCSEAGARYASMPLFEEFMLKGSMDVDWRAVEKRSRAIAEGLSGMESVRITTAAGTDISFSIKGRKPLADTGIITSPGSFSNLPAGEVYLAPVEGTAEGVLMIDWAPERKLATPLKVTVKAGMAADVEGDEPYRDVLLAGLDKSPWNRNIAELGIGTNDKAERPDNILESEKILGTVHIAFGDNTSMGGNVSTPFHQDFVFFGPTLVASGPGGEVKLLEDGRLNPLFNKV